MIGLGYSKVKSFDPTDSTGELVVDSRASLTSIVVHTKGITTEFAVEPLVFKDGSTGGDVRYKFQPWCQPDVVSLVRISHLTYQVNMGGAGIIFDDGIYFEWEAADGDDEGVDNVVLFYM